ncbi:SAG-related sequence SRS36D [Toxoplasma gondii ME49]|uniref:SAG5C n=3 Tax=Toxoplasma gondii TaxID=5811 RepID=Q6WAW5_TOXGO|nr:SAG-related sequence SRS36D [Toxoplasma gondii ME49]AAP06249.1 surface antigen 5C [Toxoplasma gondii]AAQ63834.1 SAG5C [Toxoplasma gondii]EPT28137.1 SAG-related sequence SRS36D [Toxoplasma gondii ME49]|eukprot:XP_002368569.1 SAG-related sequence SRS36D [Toxoplasma gondii ME49]
MERTTAISNKFRAAAGLLVAVLFMSSPSGVRGRAAARNKITPNCMASDNITACVCKESETASLRKDGQSDSATLSESINSVTIQCPTTGDFKFVPSTVTDVCTAEETNMTLKTCEGDNNNKKTSPITAFLVDVDGSNAPEWTVATPESKTHSLTLPAENFPRVDKKFFAGCLKTSSSRQRNADVECLVKVDVKARTSAVRDGVLICAYGDKSNTSVPEVTLNAENNSLTIQCGEEGEMQPDPKSLTAYHCTDTNIENCKTVVNLTEVMPSFAKSWWTEDDKNGKAPKLVIPEGGFPAQEETIVLGCNVRSKVSSKGQKEQANTTATLPTCRVKVTLTAQPAASHAPTPSCLGLIAVVFTPFVSFGAY